ncbi:MAG: glycosyltransferase family 2 protein [Candidatus Komeilibacteria bacterium]|nr:glycosyltransferase family 2 protein [Candidatus Komeilibacteria bacterium]
MKLSIIIVNWQTKDYLKNCLASIFQYPLNDGGMEVLVIDNASTDQSARLVQEQFPQVQLITNQHNLGFAKAINQGLYLATGDYCLLLNPDTLILPQTLDKTIATMDQNPAYGILGCQVTNPDHSLQKSVRRLPKPWSQAIILLKLHNLFPGLLMILTIKNPNRPNK